MVMQINIKILNDSISAPEYQTDSSAGMDLQAAIDKPMTLSPMQRALVPCGFSLELPHGYEAQIRARSGLALKHGISLVNGIGTIDADYRGEIGVILVNLGQEDFIIQPKDRIAQMVIAKYTKARIVIASELGSTKRGAGAFGSTGKR